MPRAVGDELNEARWLIKQFQELLDKVEVCLFVPGCDIVKLAGLALFQNCFEGKAVVEDKYPVPDV